MTNISTTIKRAPHLLLALALVLFASALLFTKITHASAGFANAYIRLDRQKAATPTTGLVCANPGTTSSDVKTWSITFPTVAGTDFTVSGTAANWQTANIAVTGIPSGTSAWPNAASATASVSGHTVTWTNSSAQTMNNGTTYCYRWTSSSALTTGAAGVDQAGTITTKDSGAVAIDSSPWATSVITNDQITVTATVPSTFTFSLGGNSDSFTGNLDPSANSVSTTGVSATVQTNAPHGYIAWVKSANAALTSSTTGTPINTTGTVNGSTTTLSAGSNGYLLAVTETADTAGNGTIDGEYDGTSANTGGTLSTSYQPIFSGSAANANYAALIKERASISASQPPASDYTDTLTVVAAGQF